nr:9914_t:CDS:2 [Entrophospora candida]
MVEWIYLTIPCPVLGCPRGDDDVGNWYHAVCGQTAKISDDDRIKCEGRRELTEISQLGWSTI